MKKTFNAVIDRFKRDILRSGSGNYSSEEEILTLSRSGDVYDNGRFCIFYQNTWGVPIIAKDLKERFHKLKEILSSQCYDIVVLIEVWSETDREELLHVCENSSYISNYFFSPGIGVPFPRVSGSGIMIFSKFPIIKTMYHSFSVNGLPHHLEHSDYYGSKGVGYCKLHTYEGNIDIFISHIHSSYRKDHLDYLPCRVSQMYELINFIKSTGKSPLILLVGDLNCQKNEVPFSLLNDLLPNFYDGWNECNNNKNEYLSSVTFNTSDNTYKNENEDAVRIDYLFYSKYINERNEMNIGEWNIYDCGYENYHTSEGYNISDHVGISATFQYIKYNNYNNNTTTCPTTIVNSHQFDRYNNKTICNTLDKTKMILHEGIKECENDKSNSYLTGILSYIFSICVLLFFNNVIPRIIVFFIMLIPIYSMYCIFYGKFILSNYIMNYKEIINEINLELANINNNNSV